MPAPFTTPVAWSVPFESEPDRPNGFFSKNVQLAIEEALSRAISNDRFLVFADYGGQANVGRYLEFFPGIDSSEAHLYLSSVSNIVAIVCSTTAVSSVAKIGFFNLHVSETIPLYELDMNGQQTKVDLGNPISPLFTMPENGELAIRVTSSSIGKPHLYLVFSSAIGSV